jgi:hypothetical protein
MFGLLVGINDLGRHVFEFIRFWRRGSDSTDVEIWHGEFRCAEPDTI